jgi:uncharacterized protein YggT (Ycf19 family)
MYSRIMTMTSVQEYEARAREAEDSPVPTFLRIGRAVTWFLYAVVVVVVIVLMTAFVLRLVGASTDAAFTRWVYRSSESAMRPFRGIFPVKEVGEVSVLDASLLFGAAAYLCLATGIDALYRGASDRLARRENDIARARADADTVRMNFDLAQQQAQFAAAQQLSAQQFAAQQEALRRQTDQAVSDSRGSLA